MEVGVFRRKRWPPDREEHLGNESSVLDSEGFYKGRVAPERAIRRTECPDVGGWQVRRGLTRTQEIPCGRGKRAVQDVFEGNE